MILYSLHHILNVIGDLNIKKIFEKHHQCLKAEDLKHILGNVLFFQGLLFSR